MQSLLAMHLTYWSSKRLDVDPRKMNAVQVTVNQQNNSSKKGCSVQPKPSMP